MKRFLLSFFLPSIVYANSVISIGVSTQTAVDTGTTVILSSATNYRHIVDYLNINLVAENSIQTSSAVVTSINFRGLTIPINGSMSKYESTTYDITSPFLSEVAGSSSTLVFPGVIGGKWFINLLYRLQ